MIKNQFNKINKQFIRKFCVDLKKQENLKPSSTNMSYYARLEFLKFSKQPKSEYFQLLELAQAYENQGNAYVKHYERAESSMGTYHANPLMQTQKEFLRSLMRTVLLRHTELSNSSALLQVDSGLLPLYKCMTEQTDFKGALQNPKILLQLDCSVSDQQSENEFIANMNSLRDFVNELYDFLQDNRSIGNDPISVKQSE